MLEKKEKRKDDLDEKGKKEPSSPFDEDESARDVIDDIDSLVDETGEEIVKNRRDEEGE